MSVAERDRCSTVSGMSPTQWNWLLPMKSTRNVLRPRGRPTSDAVGLIGLASTAGLGDLVIAEQSAGRIRRLFWPVLRRMLVHFAGVEAVYEKLVLGDGDAPHVLLLLRAGLEAVAESDGEVFHRLAVPVVALY